MDIYKGYKIMVMLIFIGPSNAKKDKSEYSTELESDLREELFTTRNYQVQQRPSRLVNVTVSLSLLTVNDLSIRDQTLSLSGYLDLKWFDSRLTWEDTSSTSQDFTDVPFLFSTETFIWTPVIIVENSVNHLSAISDSTIPMRIDQDGEVVWNPSAIYRVSCASDTTYYPLDKQECSLKISAWAYTSMEISLIIDDIASVDLSFYTENGEWSLIEATGHQSDTISRRGTTFSSLTFSITLQRRTMFHIINTLFPVVMMAILIAMVFKLPVESGEKIGFSLTVLLAYAVYLTLISAEIPSTSVTVCYLSIYLAFILAMGVVAICLTILVLNLHSQPENEEVPEWLQHFTSSVLMTLACIRSSQKRSKRSRVGVIGNGVDDASTPDQKRPTETAKKSSEELTLTWKQIATILDKTFFNIYIFVIISISLTLFLVITKGYYQ